MTYVDALLGTPPIVIVIPSIVIAPCPLRACFKLPGFVQLLSLYFAIVDERNGELSVRPPMIYTLSSVDVVA